MPTSADTFLAPFVLLPNLALTAISETIEAAATATAIGAHVAHNAHVPFADVIVSFCERVSARADEAGQRSVALAADAVRIAFGDGAGVDSAALLSATFLDRAVETAAWPLLAATDMAAAATANGTAKQAFDAVLGAMSSALPAEPGVIPGEVGQASVLATRVAFVRVSTNAALAVVRNFRGVVGGLVALSLGDFAWLAGGLRQFRRYAEYVYEKKIHGEIGPESRFPMSERLGEIASPIVERFPESFVRALEDGDLVELWNASVTDPGAAFGLLYRYVPFTLEMIDDVAGFMTRGLVDVADAQKVALCELAIMRSDLSNAAKDAALRDLRLTSPNTTIEFEHYIPLLVPSDGSVADKCFRRTASGAIFDTHTEVRSIFSREGIELAQSVISEIVDLRSFLWLFREERRAREENRLETRRKFGPEVALRIGRSPKYPLTRQELADLTAGGPRVAGEVVAIVQSLLRERGLGQVAARVNPARLVHPARTHAGEDGNTRRSGRPRLSPPGARDSDKPVSRQDQPVSTSDRANRTAVSSRQKL